MKIILILEEEVGKRQTANVKRQSAIGNRQSAIALNLKALQGNY